MPKVTFADTFETCKFARPLGLCPRLVQAHKRERAPSQKYLHRDEGDPALSPVLAKQREQSKANRAVSFLYKKIAPKSAKVHALGKKKNKRTPSPNTHHGWLWDEQEWKEQKPSNFQTIGLGAPDEENFLPAPATALERDELSYHTTVFTPAVQNLFDRTCMVVVSEDVARIPRLSGTEDWDENVEVRFAMQGRGLLISGFKKRTDGTFAKHAWVFDPATGKHSDFKPCVPNEKYYGCAVPMYLLQYLVAEHGLFKANETFEACRLATPSCLLELH